MTMLRRTFPSAIFLPLLLLLVGGCPATPQAPDVRPRLEDAGPRDRAPDLGVIPYDVRWLDVEHVAEDAEGTDAQVKPALPHVRLGMVGLRGPPGPRGPAGASGSNSTVVCDGGVGCTPFDGGSTVTLKNQVTAGSCTYCNLSYNAQGQLITPNPTSGTAPLTSITAGTGITVTGSAPSQTVALSNTAGTAGSCTYCSLTTNNQGQVIVGPTSGAAPALATTTVAAGPGLAGGGALGSSGATTTIQIANTIPFDGGAAAAINLSPQPTAATAANGLSITGGLAGPATAGAAGGLGGPLNLTAGVGGTGSAAQNPGNGGNVVIIGGSAGALGAGSGAANGGNVNIQVGAAVNGGTTGAINIGATGQAPSAINIGSASASVSVGGAMSLGGTFTFTSGTIGGVAAGSYGISTNGSAMVQNVPTGAAFNLQVNAVNKITMSAALTTIATTAVTISGTLNSTTMTAANSINWASGSSVSDSAGALLLNGASGGAVNVQINGSNKISVASTGNVTITNNLTVSGTVNAYTMTSAAAITFGASGPTIANSGSSLLINAPSGNAIDLQIAGVNVMTNTGTITKFINTLQNGVSGNEATSATAGTNGAVPSQVLGYLIWKNNAGTTIKIPFFNNDVLGGVDPRERVWLAMLLLAALIVVARRRRFG